MILQTRRRFLQSAAVLGCGVWAGGAPFLKASGNSANEKLNVAVVGVAGRGRGNMNAVARTENIVALCDVDAQRLAQAAESFPKAKQYADYRQMLEQPDIDAVLVNTPDHTHAVISVASMELGKHVYCEKPLASSIYEARLMAETAARTGVVTQMGNQLHASESVRRIAELLGAGILGPVQKVLTFCDKVLPHSGSDLPAERPPVPGHLNWDLWLGPALERPYHPVYHPFNWRVFWGLGSGNFADMGCHILDAPYWGLGLRYPIWVEAEGPEPHPHVAPQRMVIRYRFEREEGGEPLDLVWYDGQLAPPEPPVEGVELPREGALVIGERGKLLHNFRSGEFRLLPAENFDDDLPQPTLPRPEDHYVEWIEACKGRGRPASDFSYGAALTETIMAGVVAYRVGQPMDWDGPQMQARNCPEAEPFIRPPLREKW